MKIQWASKVLLVALALVALSRTAHADGVPISGTALEECAKAASFGFTGPGISVFSTTESFGCGILSCTVGSFCNMTIAVPSCVNAEGLGVCVGRSSGSVKGLPANAIGGELIFAGSAFIPSDIGSNAISVPVALAGTVQGFNFVNLPQLPGPIWNLVVFGSGEATFFGGGVVASGTRIFDDVTYTFDGKAIITPEPASLLLLGTGLLGALGVMRRKLLG